MNTRATMQHLLGNSLILLWLLLPLLSTPIVYAQQDTPTLRTQHILAQSTFFGNGSERNVNTFLAYQGHEVAPSFVSITPVMYEGTTTVSVWLHTTDTRIDVRVGKAGTPWVGMAYYVQ